MEGRTGTLGDSRDTSSPVETDWYVLACAHSIALNPVRAKMVARPEEYPWASFRRKVGQGTVSWLDLDPSSQGLGHSGQERARRYQAFVMDAIPADAWPRIRESVQRGQLTGSSRFLEAIAAKIGTRIARRGQGRPKKDRAGEK